MPGERLGPRVDVSDEGKRELDAWIATCAGLRLAARDSRLAWQRLSLLARAPWPCLPVTARSKSPDGPRRELDAPPAYRCSQHIPPTLPVPIPQLPDLCPALRGNAPTPLASSVTLDTPFVTAFPQVILRPPFCLYPALAPAHAPSPLLPCTFLSRLASFATNQSRRLKHVLPTLQHIKKGRYLGIGSRAMAKMVPAEDGPFRCVSPPRVRFSPCSVQPVVAERILPHMTASRCSE